MKDSLLWLDEVGIKDIPRVGGKNASLGEMISQLSSVGVTVPKGFATTADAYRQFLSTNKLNEKINQALADLDIEDVSALAKTGNQIRQWILEASLPEQLENAIRNAYQQLVDKHDADISFAVRSSATAEDLPSASFAGQQETFLNIKGLDNILQAIKAVFASLYNDRAITYRVHQGFEHSHVALSAGIQRMIRSDLSCSGVMFTMDTESGFQDIIFITASYGLGETVVQGAVNPDEFYVHKPFLKSGKQSILRRNLGSKAIKMIYGEGHCPELSTQTVDVAEKDHLRFCLDDKEVLLLAQQAMLIEEHYGRPMDIEWAKDGIDGQLYIVQARPETVKSRGTKNLLQRYEIKTRGKVITTGRSIGQRIGAGTARIINDIKEMDRIQAGDILVTDMTDPNWEPIMRRAAAIITNRGGRTCHAAIIAREMGIPAIVGTNNATKVMADGTKVTASCAEGDTGFVYEGLQEFDLREINVTNMPEVPLKIMMNIGNPEQAFNFQSLPNAGIGLARVEFIINRMIGIHPKALLNYSAQTDDVKQLIDERVAGYTDPVSFYVTKLAEGISTLAAAFWPKPVIVRMSDFKSNEYASLIGGKHYEPIEENPMLGFRGASRYIADTFQDCFQLECDALKKVRNDMGLTNVEIMIPFVRTVEEAREVVNLLAAQGLERGKEDLRLIMMCELPSNALLAHEFLQYFDGFSIGSNDLTQLTLGLDRDSSLVSELFDERNDAVKCLLSMAINACKSENKYVGICGQGPSDHPDLAKWLMDQGIDSVSLNPDTVVDAWLYLANEQV